MTIAGIGVDIENISRFYSKPYDKNKPFYNKIFTSNEIRYCISKPNPYQHFAARFCAKEAFIKAMPNQGIDHKSAEIVIKNHRPFIRWKGKHFLASLAHEKNKAIAAVIVA